MQLNKKIIKRDFPSRVIEGKILLVNPEQSTAFVLSEVGTRVWQLIDNKTTAKDIISKICSEFAVSEGKAKADVTDFIKHLEKENLVEVIG